MEDNISKKMKKTNPVTSKCLCLSDGTVYSTYQRVKDHKKRYIAQWNPCLCGLLRCRQ